MSRSHTRERDGSLVYVNGLLADRTVSRTVDGGFVDVNGLLKDRTAGRSIDGSLVYVDGLFVDRAAGRGINDGFVNVNGLLVRGRPVVVVMTVVVTILNDSFGHTNVLAVTRLIASTVFTLDLVNGAVVLFGDHRLGTVVVVVVSVGVDFNTSVRIGRSSGSGGKSIVVSRGILFGFEQLLESRPQGPSPKKAQSSFVRCLMWPGAERSRVGGRTAAKKTGGYWVIPGLLLLELFAVVLFTTDTRAAVAVVLPFLTDDEDLVLGGVAVLLARTGIGRGGGRVGRDVGAFPPGPVVVRELDLYLLVGACRDRLFLVGVTVRRGEDAEGDGDSSFKIQVDCLGYRVSLPLDLFSSQTWMIKSQNQKAEKKISSGFFLGKRSRKKRERKRRTLPIGWNIGTPSV